MGVVKLKQLLGYDDTLDVFGIHGLAGAFGALMTGIFANPLINEGNAGLLWKSWAGMDSVSVYNSCFTLFCNL